LVRPTTIKIASPATRIDITSTILVSTPIAQVHRQYEKLPEGKHWNERVSIDAVVQEIKQTSPRLVFLRVQDARNGNNNNNRDDQKNRKEDNSIELLLRERDGFLSSLDIEKIKTLAAQPGTILHCRGFI
jgi:DNA replication protein DnaD